MALSNVVATPSAVESVTVKVNVVVPALPSACVTLLTEMLVQMFAGAALLRGLLRR